jgi:hypothetical protein
VRIYVVIVHSTLLDLQSSVIRKKSDLKKIGKILKETKLCALIRVR